MSNEVERGFAALSSDADRGLLLSGPELRRQAGRRSGRRAGLAAAATAVLVVGAIGAGWALARDDTGKTALAPAASVAPSEIAAPSTAPVSVPPTTVAPSTGSGPTGEPSSGPTTKPTTSGPAVPKSVPARALLTAGDGISDFIRLDEPEKLREFCSKATFPSREQIGVEAGVRFFYRGPDSEPGSIPDDTIFNTVSVFRGDGARDYLGELRRAVEKCPSGKADNGLEYEFDVLGSLGVGDESVLIERSYQATDGAGEPMNNGAKTSVYVVAVRVNDAVTVVDSRGYENISSDRSSVEALARTAAKHLEQWRG
ncbi:hypothetical protein [Actinoplanes sp. URMC 104]|uniref:hypothetical protein n=1 Tax=Actinoplanes sp. URMC 104 TaxID=3423409 RepID=UPI003F1BE72C